MHRFLNIYSTVRLHRNTWQRKSERETNRIIWIQINRSCSGHSMIISTGRCQFISRKKYGYSVIDKYIHTFDLLDHFRTTMEGHLETRVIGQEEIGYALLICISNDRSDEIFVTDQLKFLFST